MDYTLELSFPGSNVTKFNTLAFGFIDWKWRVKITLSNLPRFLFFRELSALENIKRQEYEAST